jgi:hypothetical protein
MDVLVQPDQGTRFEMDADVPRIDNADPDARRVDSQRARRRPVLRATTAPLQRRA